MNIEFYFKNCTDEEKESSAAYVETKREQLEKLIAPAERNASRVEVKIERLVKKSAYKVTFQLRWPHEDLYAFEDDHTIAEAIDFAKDKLVEQIKKVYDHLKTRSSPHHRESHVKEWNAVLEWIDGEGAVTREDFFARIEPLLAALRRHLTREIGYAEMEEVLHAGDILVDEVIGDAVLEVYDSRDERPEGMTLEQWFFQSALTILKKKIEKKRRGSTRVSLERDLGSLPKDQRIDAPIEKKIDMWQPDDDLKFEQFVTREQWFDPAEKESRKELLHDLTTWVRVLPLAWREVLLLVALQGFTIDEVASIQKRAKADVQKDLESARKYLKEQLQS